jgi:hypothetical protein
VNSDIILPGLAVTHTIDLREEVSQAVARNAVGLLGPDALNPLHPSYARYEKVQRTLWCDDEAGFLEVLEIENESRITLCGVPQESSEERSEGNSPACFEFRYESTRWSEEIQAKIDAVSAKFLGEGRLKTGKSIEGEARQNLFHFTRGEEAARIMWRVQVAHWTANKTPPRVLLSRIRLVADSAGKDLVAEQLLVDDNGMVLPPSFRIELPYLAELSENEVFFMDGSENFAHLHPQHLGAVWARTRKDGLIVRWDEYRREQWIRRRIRALDGQHPPLL